MELSAASLRPIERATLALAALYQGFGYQKYSMSQFEEYSFYLQYKRFLPSEKLLSFTDLDGRLMALKPDVTPSIIKNVKVGDPKQRVYYMETVYRENRQSNTLREIHQMGLECIGALTAYDVCETVLLAKQSMSAISDRHVLELGHMGFVMGLLEALGLTGLCCEEVLSCIAAKSPHEAAAAARRAGAGDGAAERLRTLCTLSGPLETVMPRAKALCINRAMEVAVGELSAIGESLAAAGVGDLRLDLTLLNDTAFYDGILLAGYIEGVSRAVLSGGRYDGMMKQMGKESAAIGFAVYLSELELLNPVGRGERFGLVLVDHGGSVSELLRLASQAAAEGRIVRVVGPEEEIPPADEVVVVGEGAPVC